MSTVTINVEIDGQQHDISKCSWYFISPCGCTSGVMTAKDYDTGGWLTTEDQAMASWTPKRSVREQDKARGERLELGLREDVAERLKGDCPHSPKWGAPVIPDGTEWGSATELRTIHVVEGLKDGEERSAWRAPICGAAENYFEISRSVRGDKPMCKKCLAIGAAA